ncbi:peptidylprolyl isomerase [Thermophilibacter provencensis]|uniref:peptidylprolyl isomerase n=1 Tax=Thermophilibacter provencensis TaxID=1852386 RepID=UPI00294333EA|nr:peptidylprolyl isomerase [Thermophilibacter provencensis]
MTRPRRCAPVLLALVAALAVCALVLLPGCSSGDSPAGEGASEAQGSTSQGAAGQDDASSGLDPDDPYATGVHHATIEVEGYGTIEVALNANVAPITVSNFCHLAEQGFYDGLTFHRIIEGFMIQGGDPSGDGTGGSDETIKGEFSANGVDNNIPHVRGTISMARSSDYDSASSQFFIVQDTSDSLDGQYAAFGNVTSGMEVVDAICANTPVEDSNGTVTPENQPKIAKISIVD